MDDATASRRRSWALVVFGYVALEGVVLQLQGAALPAIRATFGPPAWQLGLVAPAATAGFVLTVAVGGAVAGRAEVRRLLLLGVVGGAVGAVAMGVAPTFAVFLVALLARGALGGVGRAVDRPLLSHLYPDSRGRLFGYYDMMWAVGATAGPLVVAVALHFGDWRLAYYATAVAFVPVAVGVVALPTPAAGGGDEPLDIAGVWRIARDPGVVVMAVGLVLSTGVEGGLFTWLTTYAEGRLPPGLRTVTLSVLLGAYVPGRFVVGRLVDRVGHLRLLVVLATGCLCAVAYTFLVAEGIELLVGVFLVGVTLSGQFPTLLAYATERRPEHSAPVNALAQVTGAVGIAGVPFAMGFVVEGRGVATAMPLLLVPLAVLLSLAGGAVLLDRGSP